MKPVAPKTILVVDDEEKNIELAKVILKKEGYGLLFARSGSEALALLDEASVDILVLDLMMPDIDGFEMLRRLEASGKGAQLRTIVVSALNDAQSREAVEALGAERYLAKPYDIMTLKAMLREMAASTLLDDDEADRYLSQLFGEVERGLDEAAKQQIARSFLQEADTSIPIGTQLEYLAWFFGESDAPLCIGAQSITERSYALTGIALFDRLQDRLNRVLVRRKVEGTGMDAQALFRHSDRYFLSEP